MTAHTEALRKCVEVLKQVDFKDCAESETLWHQHGLALAEAERVLRDAQTSDIIIVQRLLDAAADPMWEGHSEVSKNLLYMAAQNMENARARIVELEAAAPSPTAVVAVPEGWQLVPKQPTPEMTAAAMAGATFDPVIAGKFINGLLINYRKMLAAAPQPAAAPSGDRLVAEVVDNGGKLFCMLMDWDLLPVGTKVYLKAAPSGDVELSKPKEGEKGWRPACCDGGEEGSACCDDGCAANKELAELRRAAITVTKE